MVVRAKKKSIEVVGVQYDGTNSDEIIAFTEGKAGFMGDLFVLITIEGMMQCHEGSWVIRSAKGEYSICQKEVFEAKYEIMKEA